MLIAGKLLTIGLGKHVFELSVDGDHIHIIQPTRLPPALQRRTTAVVDLATTRMERHCARQRIVVEQTTAGRIRTEYQLHAPVGWRRGRPRASTDPAPMETDAEPEEPQTPRQPEVVPATPLEGEKWHAMFTLG